MNSKKCSTVIGENVKRIDAYDKVTGTAKYTEDLCPSNALIARIVHSKVANGIVKKIDVSESEIVAGVVKIITCFDVPKHTFATGGHPWSIDPAHRDISDRNLLNKRVRYYGDDIAVVIAENEIAAERAVRLVKVEYEEFKPALDVFEAIKSDEIPIHDEYKNNILSEIGYNYGDYEEAIKEKGLIFFEGNYETPTVQPCPIGLLSSFAYIESGKIVVTCSTQTPNILRGVVAQALGLKWGNIRIIKPYVGGAFGNMQDALYEPLNAFLTTQVGGRCVKLKISREEMFMCTRVRHKMHFHIKSAVRKDGTFVAREITAYSDKGAYASHGTSVLATSLSCFEQLYKYEKAIKATGYTVYTNKPVSGAMRGYGVPQIVFALESHVDEIAMQLKMDPSELRIKNCISKDYEDPSMPELKCRTSALTECIEKGKNFVSWDKKYFKNLDQKANLRRGVGMAIFSYVSGIYPIALEVASCRIILNEDGTVQLQSDAVELGQGTNTACAQIAAETIGINMNDVHVIATHDTDITPFGLGAYASRQTYVSGGAVKKASLIFKEKLLDYVAFLKNLNVKNLDVKNGWIIDKSGNKIISVPNLAEESFYNKQRSQHITAESTFHCKTNTLSVGVCVAEVEVDIMLGKIKILNIMNVHDSGNIISPKLAHAQVHGGMSMGIGYGLNEQMIFEENGQLLNNNFLGYKILTSMDMPKLNCDFVDSHDPTGPYGAKSLGEPPAIAPAAAIRNAVFNATGIASNSIPLTPQKLFEEFKNSRVI